MLLTDTQQALLVAFCGGVVAALYKLAQERKKTGSGYDWVDFSVQACTASFTGVLGFFLASWQVEDPSLIIACTGLASTGGYPMLLTIKNDVFNKTRERLLQPVPNPVGMAKDAIEKLHGNRP